MYKKLIFSGMGQISSLKHSETFILSKNVKISFIDTIYKYCHAVILLNAYLSTVRKIVQLEGTLCNNLLPSIHTRYKICRYVFVVFLKRNLFSVKAKLIVWNVFVCQQDD